MLVIVYSKEKLVWNWSIFKGILPFLVESSTNFMVVWKVAAVRNKHEMGQLEDTAVWAKEWADG